MIIKNYLIKCLACVYRWCVKGNERGSSGKRYESFKRAMHVAVAGVLYADDAALGKWLDKAFFYFLLIFLFLIWVFGN